MCKRIVDKAPVNSDYLGVIHSVFPKARIIYVQRDPIDTCLSCYFQELPLTLNFALDLDDLTHYYKEHRRLIEHWRAVLPPGSILDVPYESLVADQEAWTRKILEFIGLDWNDAVPQFRADPAGGGERQLPSGKTQDVQHVRRTLAQLREVLGPAA